MVLTFNTIVDSTALALYISVTLIIFLKTAEFNGEYARPMDYENGNKNIFGLLVVIELKDENSTILTYKLAEFVRVFLLKNMKKGDQLL